jgi:hypothetical protein
MTADFPIAIIGAGPVGLAAAVHLLDRGLVPLLLEAGPKVGHSIRQWAHVAMFSPWGFTLDRAAKARLEATGWTAPAAEDVPTGGALVSRYLEPLAALPEIAAALRLDSRVVAVGRKEFDKVKTAGRDRQPFVLTVETPRGRETIEASAVIDASGTWATPNPVGSGGLPVPGEDQVADRIAYGIPDVLGTARATYRDRATMVVGSGHSAINAVLDLTGSSRPTAPATTHGLWRCGATMIDRACFGGGRGRRSCRRAARWARAAKRAAIADGRHRASCSPLTRHRADHARWRGPSDVTGRRGGRRPQGRGHGRGRPADRRHRFPPGPGAALRVARDPRRPDPWTAPPGRWPR